MVGGAISGYCAIGNMTRATTPMMIITTEMTVEKTGRSTKKRANMVRPLLPSFLGGFFLGGLVGWLRAGHGSPSRLDFHSIPHALNAVDDDPLVGLYPLENLLQSIAQHPQGDVAALDGILRVDHVK